MANSCGFLARGAALASAPATVPMPRPGGAVPKVKVEWKDSSGTGKIWKRFRRRVLEMSLKDASRELEGIIHEVLRENTFDFAQFALSPQKQQAGARALANSFQSVTGAFFFRERIHTFEL